MKLVYIEIFQLVQQQYGSKTYLVDIFVEVLVAPAATAAGVKQASLTMHLRHREISAKRISYLPAAR